MQGSYSQSDTASAAACRRAAGLSGESEAGYPVRLAVETTVVTVGTLAVIRFLNVQHISDLTWLAIPCLLVTAALLPTWLRNDAFAPVAPDRKQTAGSLVAVGYASICTFPAVFFGLWLITRLGWPIPLGAAVGQDNWLAWLIYQFLYVAVAEEMFFRGYLQVNVMRLLSHIRLGPHQIGLLAGAAVSAGGFAAAHFAVQGQVVSLLTFLPGLVLAWLFIRTQSLLAPILFHGLANIAYSLMTLVFS
jgi:membrane protease YdiL (CAAX protease family)